jgi:hypothetical protein
MLIGFAVFGLASCTENPASPTSGTTNVIMVTAIDNSGGHSSLSSSINGVSPPGSTVDSIIVTTAGFIVSDFSIRSDTADTDPQDNLFLQQIRPEQFMLNFDIAGKQYIGERQTTAAIYRSARFSVHWASGKPDSLAQALNNTYVTLFGGSATFIPGATIVIKGFVYQGESQEPFLYATHINGALRVIFDPVLNVPASGAPITMAVKFTTARAFSSGGMMMDPRDFHNQAAIEANLPTTLRGSISGS